MNIQNLTIRGQLLVPVVISIVLFVASILFSQKQLRDLLIQVQVSERKSQDLASLLLVQHQVAELLLASANESYRKTAWEKAQREYKQRQPIIESQLLNVVLASESQLQQDKIARFIDVLERYGRTQSRLALSIGQLDERSKSLPLLSLAPFSKGPALSVYLSDDNRAAGLSTIANLYEVFSQINGYLVVLREGYNPSVLDTLRFNIKAIEKEVPSLPPNINNRVMATFAQYGEALSEMKGHSRLIKEDRVLISRQGLKLRQLLAEISGEVEQQSQASMASGWSKFEDISEFLIAAVVLVSVFSIMLAVWVADHIKRDLEPLSRVMMSMRQGDLTKTTNTIGENEIGRLCSQADDMAVWLQKTVNELSQLDVKVMSSAKALVAVMDKMETNTREQNKQIERIASASTQLISSADQVTQVATEAESYATKGLIIVNEGVTSAQQRRRFSEELIERLKVTLSTAEHLAMMSAKVTGFVILIQEVAERTNLLALNAAVEASRAGNAGRGFSVVASEVRVLAKKASDNTASIQELVDELQSGAQKMLKSVTVCLDKVAENAQLAEESEQDMRTLHHGITKMLDQNSEMALAAKEQSRALTSVNENIHNMNDNLSESAVYAKQSSETASYLSTLSEQQQTKLSHFKTG
ncbi:methyl-accepting chemotaxis protein [Vibrio ostreicida]|uniref:methyl-accepting chemotaxis protein n=1 Tax=Vibrio ostreicida TaxID=526588 RepID=UPI003B5B3B10